MQCKMKQDPKPLQFPTNKIIIGRNLKRKDAIEKKVYNSINNIIHGGFFLPVIIVMHKKCEG